MNYLINPDVVDEPPMTPEEIAESERFWTYINKTKCQECSGFNCHMPDCSKL